LTSELKRLSSHHLNFNAFIGYSRIDVGRQAFGPESHPRACDPFYVFVHIIDAPVRRQSSAGKLIWNVLTLN
jgi:hypothetical protein